MSYVGIYRLPVTVKKELSMHNLLQGLLDLTEDCKVEKVLIGLYSIAVKGKRLGLSSTLHKFIVHKPPIGVGELQNKTSRELGEYILHDNLLEQSIGMAAINSSIKIDESYFTDINAFGVIKEKAKDKVVSVVGEFPFVKDLKNLAKELYVFERKSGPDFLNEEDMPEYLPRSEVAVITGTSIFNHSFINITKHIKPETYTVVLGPSTPLTTLLFEYNINLIGGVLVKDEDILLNYVSQATPFNKLKGKRMICMEKE